MIVAFRVSDATCRRCMEFFSNLMIFVVGIVLEQHATQLTVGWKYWPNLDRILPANLLIPFFKLCPADCLGHELYESQRRVFSSKYHSFLSLLRWLSGSRLFCPSACGESRH